MIAAFDAIVDFLLMIVDFVVMIVTHIINFIASIPTFFNFLVTLFGYMPAFLQWFLTAALLYGVIDLIIAKVRGNE